MFPSVVLIRVEKDQLQSRFNNLSNSYRQSQTEMKQLKDQITGEKCFNKTVNRIINERQGPTLHGTHVCIQFEVVLKSNQSLTGHCGFSPDILGLEKEELLFRYDDLNKNYTLIQDKHAGTSFNQKDLGSNPRVRVPFSVEFVSGRLFSKVQSHSVR